MGAQLLKASANKKKSCKKVLFKNKILRSLNLGKVIIWGF